MYLWSFDRTKFMSPSFPFPSKREAMICDDIKDEGLVCTNLYVISSLVLPQAMTLLLRILFYWEDMKLLLNILSRLPRWSEIRPASLQRPCSFCCILFGGWIVNFLKKFITIFIISFCHILINISLCNLFKKWCLVILPILEKSYVF